MRSFAAIIAASAAALTISVSGFAQSSPALEQYRPAVVFLNEDQPEAAAQDSVFSAAPAQDGRLYLEDTADIPVTEDAGETEESSSKDILKMIVTSLIAGIVIALIVCLVMKSRMKTAVPKLTANDYIRKNSFNITRSRDIFIYSNVTKKKRQKPEDKK